jgi:AhpD family alkylhydroperoxidase
MAVVPLLTDDQADPQARALFDDIRATRGTDHINDIWRALANDPQLQATWREVKRAMAPGALDALTKGLVYIAVSAANSCRYCLHTHSAAARAKGMSPPGRPKGESLGAQREGTPVTEAMFRALMQVVFLASQPNRIAIGLQVEVDDRHLAPGAA